MKVDNIHYSLNKILSYNKSFNFVISAREAGKSTATWLYSYKKFQQGYTTLVVRRLINDITETYIQDIENIINKFNPDDPIKLQFKKGSIKEGVVDVKVNGEIFFRVIALSNPLSRIKSLMLPRLFWIVFDEFICNTRLGEKYLSNEVFKFKEIYNTFQRESENGLKVLFAGNPYSLYNPYFSWVECDIKKLYPGAFVTGENWVIEVYELTQELKDFILSRNPLYKFDDSYTKYAFDGRAINDDFVQVVEKLPEGFGLKFVFYIHGKTLGVYRNNNPTFGSYFYWVSVLKDYQSSRRDIACFDFNELIEGNYLIGSEDKKQFLSLKNAFRFREVRFRTIEESYLFEEIYTNI